MKSLTEHIEVEFNELNHTYHHEGQAFTCFSTWVKQYYEPFNANAVSSQMSKRSGVPKEDIQAMWKSNGTLSANLGNLVEEAIQHYEKHCVTGWKIGGEKSMACTDKDKALPKHPLLKTIVREYVSTVPVYEGQIVSQALVTDKHTNKAGTIDRLIVLDWDKKLCRIEDYKAHIDADKIDRYNKPLPPFDHLPACKLTKYQIQMSFYANLLERHGWTVEGLDALVYEDTWKVYPLDVIRGKWFDDVVGFNDPLGSFV